LRIFHWRITLFRHNCRNNEFARALQVFIAKGKSSDLSDQCPLYWKMKGGDTYHGNLYYFTFAGIRLVIQTTRKKSLWIK